MLTPIFVKMRQKNVSQSLFKALHGIKVKQKDEVLFGKEQKETW